MSQFFTIKKKSESQYKEKGSKFLAFAISVASEIEIKDQLKNLQEKYHDARHYCYAYIIGMSEPKWRANDDGEPSHSAGDPILGQIRSFELTNVLVVVVRYFGGTKLGVGGLINAYKTAAEKALVVAGRKEIYMEVNVNFHFPYDLVSVVERLITTLDIAVIDRDFQQDCRISARMRSDLVDELNIRTADLYNLELSITE